MVVREIEGWLLADREGMAAFLGVSLALIPAAPEALANPKQTLVNLARGSRRRHVKAALVPAEGVSAVVGPEYVIALQEFVGDAWDVGQAGTNALSLQRTVMRLWALQDNLP